MGKEGIAMPWCPLCKTEYREGFAFCQDCKADLVDALPPDTAVPEPINEETQPKAAEPWVFLTSTLDDSEAVIIESLLRSNGIPVMKKHDGVGAVLRVFQVETTNFPVDLYVRESQYTQARELLGYNYQASGK